MFRALALVGLIGSSTWIVADETAPALKSSGQLLHPEKLSELKAAGQTYHDVTITSVTATDIYFEHSLGISNVKLRDLPPDLQRQFGYDPAKANQQEKNQRNANTRYHENVKTNEAAKKAASANSSTGKPAKAAARDAADDDPVAPELYAKSFRGKAAPQILVGEWLTPPPDAQGKFVLVDFWATWCGPCRQAIPHLNSIQAKFKDKVVVIGLSDEAPGAIRKMKSPKMEYSVASDTQARTMREVQVKGIPHALLVDPQGIVRFEGMPEFLTEPALSKLIAKYSD